MTEHEISNLQPGPELDWLVAEACGIETQFLGHERSYDAVDGNLIPSCPRCGQTGQQARSDVAVVCHRPFRPSTDWNDAMRALDRIVGEDESLFPADSVLLECDRAGWFAGLDRVTSWRLGDETNDWKDTPIAAVRVGWAYGETGPLAICRAILQAKLDDNEDS